MQWIGRVIAACTIFLAAFLVYGQDVADSSEALWHYRNLGKAFYENPMTPGEAVEWFQKALALAPDSPRERLNYGLALLEFGQTEEGIAELERVQQQAPEIPHTWFNLGIAYKRQGQYQRSREQFEQMVVSVPDEPVTHYNLGILFRLEGEPDRALQHFETAAGLDSNLAGPHYQLYNMYRLQSRSEEAARALERFRQLKLQQTGRAVEENLEWSVYAEIYGHLDPLEPASTTPLALRFQDVLLAEKLEGEDPRLLVLDADGDGNSDLLGWTNRQTRLYRRGRTRVEPSGLEDLREVTSIAPGDFNNDGLPDLCVITPTGPILYLNQQGTFQEYSSFLLPGPHNRALWVDVDHDNDLDLFLFGRDSMLLRNNGSAGFSDHSQQFPFRPGEALDATFYDLIKDREVIDLVVTYREGPIVIYQDRLFGQYEALSLSENSAGVGSISAEDLNNDGWTDLAALSDSEAFLLLNREGNLEKVSIAATVAESIFLADLGNRGVVDLVLGSVAHQNEGLGQFASGQDVGVPAPVESVTGADFNGDGLLDLAVVTEQGEIHLLENKTESSNHWLQASLTGVRNLSTAPGAKVEVRAGSLYQKKTYQGIPLSFGLGSYEEIDVIRITWPNGLIQNETQQPTGLAFNYEEKERLSGSCPTLFAWNGQEFEFITDMLGAAALGLRVGEDEYFVPDHDEYIQIPGGSLARMGQHYEIRITEELREVAYLDQLRLIAVDHPQEIDLFTNDKLKATPASEWHLYGVEERFYPLRAHTQRGGDVRSRIIKQDRSYPDEFRRDASGVAEMHSLELDFGSSAAPDNRALLVLNGWMDWADSSAFLRLAQQGIDKLTLPYLQVKDSQGRWQTVIEDMGVPAGKPKTIVVDLTDKFLSSSREVRIVTNLSLYWDEIFMTQEVAEAAVHMNEVPLTQADLQFRGFSTAVIHPQRKQPEWFDYSKWTPVSMWNPTSGFYTRYGDVGELLESVDDRFMIMGSGDEVRLLFSASELPALQEGFKRDFLLYVNGWVKDGDLNTAFARSVEPLPFHGMSGYPYAAGERYPQDPQHQHYREQYNTRPALRLLGPLSPIPAAGESAAAIEDSSPQKHPPPGPFHQSRWREE
jgi:Tfp pilus assembly protein PilF